MNGSNKLVEVLKNAVSIGQALLPLLEKWLELLPVNPALRRSALQISIVLAAAAGFGAYQTIKRNKVLAVPWIALALSILAVVAIFALTGGVTFGLNPVWLSSTVQTFYILTFVFLGAAIGGFTALS